MQRLLVFQSALNSSFFQTNNARDHIAATKLL